MNIYEWVYLWQAQPGERRWEKLNFSSSLQFLFLPLWATFLSSLQSQIFGNRSRCSKSYHVLDISCLYLMYVRTFVHTIRYSEFWMSSIFDSIFAILSEILVSCAHWLWNRRRGWGGGGGISILGFLDKMQINLPPLAWK